MKFLKKAFPIMLALIMALTMGGAVFAAGNGTITVNNMETGRTYEIYRIFDMTLSGGSDNLKVSYSIADKWVGAFFSGGALIADEWLLTAQPEGGTLNEILYNGTVYYLNVTESNVADFANYLNYYAVNISSDGAHTAVASDNGSYVFTGLALGYYLVFPVGSTTPLGQNSSVCSLTNTKPNATVIPKGDYPFVNKTADDQDVELGQTVTFTLRVPLPGESVSGYDNYWYKLTDTMSEGLTFGNTFAANNFTVKVVYSEGADTVLYGINEDEEFVNLITVADGEVTFGTPANGFTLLADVRSFIEEDGELVVTYDAVVNEGAIVNYTYNRVELDYGHDPDSLMDGGGDEVPVYSSRIIVEKYDAATEGEEEKTYLADAKFVLYKVVADEIGTGSHKEYCKFTPAAAPAAPASVTWINESDVAEDWSNVTVGTTNAMGITTFAGLESGTYFLQEIEAPSGYNKLANDIEVVISAPAYAEDDIYHTRPIGVSLTKPVANSSGSVLPETGGIGTTIFYILGAVILVGAGVTLLVRRRMSAEE